jgi:hypothetical protein
MNTDRAIALSITHDPLDNLKDLNGILVKGAIQD